MLVFFNRSHDCTKKIKIPHIIHITNQYRMDKSFSYRYGSIPQEKINKSFFGSCFDILVVALIPKRTRFG
jgi:hypothetical protein